MIPFAPPEASAVASCSALPIIALRFPPQRGEVGKGCKCTTPIMGFGVLNICFKSTDFPETTKFTDG
jgi:hypothetical protein